MRQKLLFLFLLFACNAHAQFDNAIGRFISDSDFTIQTDIETGREYVNIQPFHVNMKTVYTRLYFNVYNDYSNQPVTILDKRDSIVGGDTLHLHAIFGKSQSANAFFTLSGDTGSEQQSIGITNNNSNAYNGCHVFLSTKFLYWYFADKNGITIQ